MRPAELLHPSRSHVAGLGLSLREVLRTDADTVTAKLLHDLVQERGAGTRLPLERLRRRFPAPPARG